MNNLTNQPLKPKFSVAIQTDTYKKLVANTLGDSERAKRFVAAISSAVAVNADLQECDAGTILSGALLGEALNLSPSPQLGQYYLVPFNSKTKGKIATFILGYKGYIQLAIRSGNYKKINVIEIKEGELIQYDPLNEDIDVSIIQDDEEREKTPTLGYYAMFEETTGFKKIMYWSKKKMIEHADKYSPAFTKKGYELYVSGKVSEKDLWKYSSHWYKDFDSMAKKTMLRQLISKWGIMSIDMQRAFENDEKTLFDNGTGEYVKDIELPEPVITNINDEPAIEIEPIEKKPKSPKEKKVEETKRISFDEL